jgi:hypothetical protein
MEIFINVLHVPLFSINILSIYHITHSGTRKASGVHSRFNSDFRDFDGSKVAVGVADHQSRLYVFSHFIPKYPSVVLLTHVNEVNRLWHEIFGHLNYCYLQQLSKQGMVTVCRHKIF